jgi:DNA repair photolyase
MRRVSYIETTCKTALNRVRGMPFAWSLNPYRGCVHACHYCYARASHAFLGMNAGADFETKIVVKTNVADVLRRELARPSWHGDAVALGTVTDPYQPCEGRYRLTRRVLEALREFRNPASITTKSTLVLRDLDLLADLQRVAGVTVYVTVTTLDPQLWRLIEPGTPPPRQRLSALRRLREAGVPAGVFMMPILPGITDSVDSIDDIAAAAAELGAVSFSTSPLRLAPLVKEHYLGFVGTAFPDLLSRYERAYSGIEASLTYRDALARRVERIRVRYGFGAEPLPIRRQEPVVAPRAGDRRSAGGQLALPL